MKGSFGEYGDVYLGEYVEILDMEIRVKLTSGILPQKAYITDAGWDFFLPNRCIIEAGQNKVVGLGLHIEIPEGYFLKLCNRSSIASKNNVILGACIIDSGYTGEVKVDLHNLSVHDVIFQRGTKIAQGIILPVYDVNFVVSEALKSNTARSDGGFGSTD